MPPRAYTQAEWDEHAEEIRELLKKKTFTEVAAFMETERNFAATERQYKYRFGSKKNLTEEEWKWIHLEMQRRAAAGKDSHVYFNEILQSTDRVNRATARYGKRAYSEVDQSGMSNPAPKRISVRTPPASTPEPILDQRDIPWEIEEGVRAQQGSASQATIAQTSGFSSMPDPGLRLEADGKSHFDAAFWASTSPISLSPSAFEAFSAFEFLETNNADFALVQQTSPGEMGRDGRRSPVLSFFMHNKVQQWMTNLPIFQLQRLLEQQINIPPHVHSAGGHSPLATASTFNGVSTAVGRLALPNLLASVTEIRPGESFSQMVSKLEQMVRQKEPHVLSKHLGHVLDSRSVPSSGVWFLFGLLAYFVSNNILGNFHVDSFLEWVIVHHFTKQLELFVDIKTPTVEIFSVKILESAIRRGNFALAKALLRRGIMLDRPLNTVAWIDDAELANLIIGGASPEVLERDGLGFLLLALKRDRLDLAQKLVGNGVSVNYEECGETPLYAAASMGNVLHVRFLLECGADVNSRSYDKIPTTALAVAILKGRTEIVAMLLEHRASTVCIVENMDIFELTSLEDRNMYNLLKKRVGDVGFKLGDLVFAAAAGTHLLEAYKSSYQERITAHQLERALHESVRRENLAAIVTLLQYGVDPEGGTLHERPLETALGTGHPYEVCQLLINLGATIEVPGILRRVVNCGDSCYLLPLFLESGANLDHQCNGALVKTAENGDIRSAMYLLARGVDVNTRDLGWTPIQAAARFAHSDMVELLLSYNANIDAPAYPNAGRTALQAALESRGGYYVAELLLDRGADVSAPPASVKGLTALEAACSWWDEEYWLRRVIVRRLLDAGAPIHRPGGKPSSVMYQMIKFGEDALLHRILPPCYDAALEQMLAEPIYDRNKEELHSRTPIQLAAEWGRISQVKMLCYRGANINADPAPRFGRTALQAAASTGSKEVVEFLLANGAEINAKPAVYGGITALQGAAISGNVPLVALLLEKGSRVNEEPSILEGRYAIEGAAEYGRLDTVQLLLNAGAKGDVRRKMGFQFAIELAEKYNHDHVVTLLEEAEDRRQQSGANEE